MLELNEVSINKLDKIASSFNLKLYMPPVNKNIESPFFSYKELEHVYDTNMFTNELLFNGFSFIFDNDKNILILGHTNDKF